MIEKHNIRLKFNRVSREFVNSKIHRKEYTDVITVPRTMKFTEIKRKYLIKIGEEDSKEPLKFIYNFSTIADDLAPEDLYIYEGMDITPLDIEVNYKVFIWDDKLKFDQVSSVFSAGVNDKESSLYVLGGCPHIQSKIMRLVLSYWEEVIKFPSKVNADVFHRRDTSQFNEDYAIEGKHPDAFFFAPIYPEYYFENTRKRNLKFPFPSQININMMPFILKGTFEDCKLPDFVKPYWKMIETCIRPEFEKKYSRVWDNSFSNEVGRVCYLTIQESFVKKGTCQRRPGLHVDNPGYVKVGNGSVVNYREGDGHSNPYFGHHWGSGGAHVISRKGPMDALNHIVITGGIYMASSLPDSCMAWNCKIVPDKDGKEAIRNLGDIEYLRHLLPQGHLLDGNQMYWMTDRTPHESLPLGEMGNRQFFRLVTSNVSLWYKDYSTLNPLGVVPDANITWVVRGNKFSEEGVEIEKL